MTLEWVEEKKDFSTGPLDWWFRIYPRNQDPRRKTLVTQFGALDDGDFINASIGLSFQEMIGLAPSFERNDEIARLEKQLAELMNQPIFAPLVDDGITIQSGKAPDFSLPERAKTGLPEFNENTVLVAVIDDLISPLNRRFLRSSRTETRFLYLWQQDRRIALDSPAEYTKRVAIGQEFFATDLNDALQNAPSEQQAYSDLKLIEDGRTRLLRGDSHGAAVANVVAGAEPGTNVLFVDDDGSMVEGPPADDVHFLGVNLHHAVVHDASGTFMQAIALSAFVRLVQYITFLEQEAGRLLPVVLNFSFGLSSGAPSEIRPLAIAMELYAAFRRLKGAETRIMLPAGNHRQSRLLAEVDFVGPRKSKSFKLRVTPVSGSSAQFQINTEARNTESLVLYITTPDGAFTGTAPTKMDQVSLLQDEEKRPVAAIYRTPTGFYCGIAPTRADDSAGYCPAPAGYWTIILEATGVVKRVRVQVRRGDTPGRRRLAGEMSALCDPTYEKFDESGGHADNDGEFIKRKGTISSLVGPPSGYVVGSKTSRRFPKHSAYSGKPDHTRGPGVFVETLSDAHRSLPGLASVGTYSDVSERIGGTSAACARKAREFVSKR